MAWYFECTIQCFFNVFDVLIKILESYRPQIPSDPSHLSSIWRTCVDEDRVDSGPRDRRFVLGSDDSDATTRPAKVSFRGD